MKYVLSLLLLSQFWAFQNQNEQMMSPIVAYWKTLNQEEAPLILNSPTISTRNPTSFSWSYSYITNVSIGSLQK